MHRKIKDQAKRKKVCVPTIRGWMKQGLRYTQLPTGTIYISDEAIEEHFKRFEKCDREPSEIAASLTAKVI